MRIPLDYYRIIGVPIEATDELLSQAYGSLLDRSASAGRSSQLPLQEYSSEALDARQKLLEQAYQVLSDPKARSEYNEQSESAGPSLEIADSELVGALMILQELGEYELVLRLAHPYLDPHHTMRGTIRSEDLVLTIALTCLELSREQWQQGEYENAAASGETGQDLLLRFGLFPDLRRVIESDLDKLRPYRILELLALSTESVERPQGLQLLQEMLQERGGIDGNGNDGSGLNIDDFLCFIQQLRSYLTVAEQQELFSGEARRPSAVASYLAVYADLARGFAEKSPAFIARAAEMLVQLGQRQDVHLEQAISALLLGQTEAANHALELSGESEALTFIREHSEGEPDLLPGLCLYGESWLETEVFSHFRDLDNHPVSLKDYFAEEQVQAYLGQLSASESDTVYPLVADPEEVTDSDAEKSFTQTLKENSNNHSVGVESNADESVTTGVGTSIATIPKLQPHCEALRKLCVSFAKLCEALRSNRPRRPAQGVPPKASRVSVPRKRPACVPAVLLPKTASSPRRGLKKKRSGRELIRQWLRKGVKRYNGLREGQLMRVGWIKANARNPKLLVWLVLAVILAGGSFGFVLSKLFGGPPIPRKEVEKLSIHLNKPAVPIPPIELPVDVGPKPLSKEEGKKAIAAWLSAKSNAFGSRYQIDQLKTILVDPELKKRSDNAKEQKKSDSYKELEHKNLTVLSVNNSGENRATVIAEVRENDKKFQNGKLIKNDDDIVKAKYNLVRQNSKWLIEKIEVLTIISF